MYPSTTRPEFGARFATTLVSPRGEAHVDVGAVVTAYGSAWNEPDEGARRQLLESAWADDATYCDPTANIEGREALIAHIGALQVAMPGHTIDVVTAADEHDGHVRFGWVMHGPDGTDYKNTHRFVEIIKHKKIVLDHITGPKFRITVTFTEQGNKTLLTWNSLFESAEQLEQVIKVFKADEGLKQNIDKLEQYLAEI